jgi:predicted MPP superfamily phosphohydrolase
VKRTAKWLGATFGVLLLLTTQWGGVVEPYWLDVRREEAVIPGLPPEWDERRVAVLADWQIGMWMPNTSTMRRATERAIQERPVAVLLAGDFVYHADDEPAELTGKVVALLRPLLEAGIPTYAVLGQSRLSVFDYGARKRVDVAAAVRNGLSTAGIRVLHNEAAALRPRGTRTPLYLVGLGEAWAAEDEPAAAVAAVPGGQPRLVFMHNPNSYDSLPSGTAPLAIAAHTHAGQLRIPAVRWLRLARGYEVHSAGWISGFGEPGNRLYVKAIRWAARAPPFRVWRGATSADEAIQADDGDHRTGSCGGSGLLVPNAGSKWMGGIPRRRATPACAIRSRGVGEA